MKQRAEYNTMFDQNVAFEFGLLCQFLPFFNELLSIQNVIVARFAHYIQWDFFCDFKTPCGFLFASRASNVNVSALPQHLQSTNSLASSNSSTTVGCDSTMTENNTAAAPQGDQQVMVVCTEKSAAVYSLPSQRQMYMQTINESSNVVAANIINFGGVKFTPCLVTYTADGFLKAFSLPSLRPMLDMYFMANKDPRIALTMSFSNYGHGLYMANATEVCSKAQMMIFASGLFFFTIPNLAVQCSAVPRHHPSN